MLQRVEPKTLNPKYENNLREDHLFYCLLAAIRIINQPLIPRYVEIPGDTRGHPYHCPQSNVGHPIKHL